jgi:hypothetical protein
MFVKGDRVNHPLKPDWGIGQILEIISESQVKVFFVNAGEKILDVNIAKLGKLSGAQAAHPLLDNPQTKKTPRTRKLSANKRSNSLQEAVQYFVRLFPEGFDDKGYLENERNYKLDANQLILQLLNEQALSQLLEANNYDEICNHARQVMNRTNLVFRQEKIIFQNGLEITENKKPFSETLFNLLYGHGEYEQRFKIFADCLLNLGAAKWTIVTYFPYLRYPNEHIFLKPMATQRAADICNFELNYHPDVNWLTYMSFTKFAHQLFVDLETNGLKPRDMIDVQSFIWCIDQDSYEGV